MYEYWSVDCKTPNCGRILLDCIGPKSRYAMPIIPQCDPFEIKCGGCGYVHCYSPLDLLNVEYSVPCGELPAAIAFREAILRARRRHDAEIGELPQ